MFLYFVVFGRLLAKVGPRTPFDGSSGSKLDAERIYNWPSNLITKPFRGEFLAQAKNIKCKMAV